MSVHIYHGPWVNWSLGLIKGSTLTLGEREGGLLTAFIAVFVTIVGSQLWKVVCYAAHQFRSTSTPQDGLYHQQQVIFKNTAGPVATAWLLLEEAWCWSGRARRSLLRTVPWAVFSIAYVAVIGIAAIFSSQISKCGGSTRLIVSDGCGTWQTDTDAPLNTRLNGYNIKMANESAVATSYAKACYGGTNDSLACSKFPVPSISWSANTNATCPFESGVCLFGDTAAFQATSKLIDSHLDLGINTPASSRILLEKTTTCAPLRTRGFAEIINASDLSLSSAGTDPYGPTGRDSDQLFVFYYGEQVDMTNITYWYNDHASFDQASYSLSPIQGFAGRNSTGTFVPAPAINAEDADVSLLFVAANAVRYMEPCLDPVFSANKPAGYNDPNTNAQQRFNPDRYVNVIGCTEQYRVCNPNNNMCTDKLGIYQYDQALMENNDTLQLNTLQSAIAKRLISAFLVSSIYLQTAYRLGGSLSASDTLQGLDQPYLPPNQWHIEVGSWFDTGLARIQHKTQEYATGPAIIPEGTFVGKPDPSLSPEEIPYKFMCHSQMVHDSSNSMSFSIAGLAILLIVGAAIIFAGLALDTIIGWLQDRLKSGLHAKNEWTVHDKLYLQKLLHEEMKLGKWDGSKSVPVTRSNERFLGPVDRQLGVPMLLAPQNAKLDDGSEAQLVEEHVDEK